MWTDEITFCMTDISTKKVWRHAASQPFTDKVSLGIEFIFSPCNETMNGVQIGELRYSNFATVQSQKCIVPTARLNMNWLEDFHIGYFSDWPVFSQIFPPQ